MKKVRQSKGLPLSNWVYAVAMALVAVTVTASVVSTTWLATQTQDVRSYAAEPTPQTPVVTSIKVESASSTSSSQTVTIDENGEVETSTRTFGGFNVSEEESSESTSVAGGVLTVSDSTPQGIKIIYVLLGLGVVIGGLAFGLILLVKKLLGT